MADALLLDVQRNHNRRAVRTMWVRTSQLAMGSPPWNSMVSQGLVVESAMATAFSAVSRLMSVSVRSIPTTELWQYWHP